jgi:Zn-dependent M16 (insulinase) family peptidase
LTKSIIGTIGNIDTYQLPDAKGYTAMIRTLTNLDEEYLQKFREQVLSTTIEDFKAFADSLASLNENACVIVIGSAEKINAANQKRGNGWLKVKKVL